MVNIGIIGLGGGASQMIPAFVRHPQLRITAVADTDQAQLDQFRKVYSGETYLSASALCRSSQVDAVYIATPNQFHTEHALMALEQGKHVLVEKPMTLNLKNADRMIEAADRHRVQLAVNVKHSFEPRIRKLREIVLRGELGQLRMLNYWYFSDWLYNPRTTEELNPALGGGVPWRQGPHKIDIIRTVAGGLVRSVRATTGVWDASRPVAGSYSSFLEFEDGVVATVVYSGHDHFNSKTLTHAVDDGPDWAAPEHARARKALQQAVSGEAETAMKKARRFGGSSRSGPSSPWILGGPLIVSFDRGDVRLTPKGLLIYGDEAVQEIVTPAEVDGHDGVADEFYQALTGNRPPLNHGRWGKATLEVLLALFESGRVRKEVFLSHQVAVQD
ncbi:gfo/Idh/MocA family oxidoreductase [Candidatus Entotheonella serta]|nr:gfo/Idh/MocA family oxidoreductase [Candidatus Entotheonella serta]